MDNLNVVIAPDSFKGSASSYELGRLISQGVKRVVPNATIRTFSIADGGEGTLDALINPSINRVHTVSVCNPLGEPIIARYGFISSDTAIIEVAQAVGLTLIEQTPEHAINASSYGVGQMVLDAIDHGAKNLYIGLGGSAVSDGGVGMAKALGVRFLDEKGDEIQLGLEGLGKLHCIDISSINAKLGNVAFTVLTDVDNPLVGPRGAIHTFGSQKGIPANKIDKYDSVMTNYATLLNEICDEDIASRSGAGAAGGLGAALMAFCSAKVVSGIDFVIDSCDLVEALDDADLVIVGEGRMDQQSVHGKAPVGIAQRAMKVGVPVVALVGSRSEDLDEVYQQGISMVLPCQLGPCTLEESLKNVTVSVPIAAETAVRALIMSKQLLK